ncbi:MAG: sensor histidine kinase [Neptuniibacter sp.]
MVSRAYSIRNQLLVMASCTLIVFASAAFYIAQKYGERAAQLSYDRLMTGAAHQIAEGISLHDGEIIVNLPVAAFQTLSLAETDRAFYKISSEKQGLLTGYDDIPVDQKLLTTSPSLSTQLNPTPVFYEASYKGEQQRLLILSKLITETNYQDVVHIQLAQTTEAREQLANEISVRALQLTTPFFILALVLVMLGIWQLLRPISRVNRALSHRSASDLHPLQFPVPSEIVTLVATINRFMKQLGDTLDSLKRFTSEAAHQIRTPLAGLKSQAQNALEEEDPALRKEQLNRVVESCDMLTSTVNQLLDQATLAHRFQSEAKLPVRLDLLTKQVCRDVALTAIQQGVEISFNGECESTVQGDEFALTQMLRNILENAIKYSPEGASLDVELKAFNDNFLQQSILEVRDFGPGIPDSEKDSVFERFYRSPNNPRKGTGLGLAIAKDVAEYHGATLTLLDNEPHGLIVRITFDHYLG